MSDAKPKKRPDFTAYFIPDRENANWVAIGAAWSHGDSEGFNLKFDLIPSNPGRIVLRKPKAEAAPEAGGAQ
jgi:hypothetical protein